ncbi:MAG: aminotransferase class V-fold PLP-dependent enzyme [Chloroflexi bacterium]|nr:MAG: aminotransferase class V-fold PLP-dependent enzyme [Chloroflexota bacterium]
MTIYEELGIRPLINASATLTRLGGSLMPPEVVQAMVDASKVFIDLEELQRKVGDKIAELTHNEACYVSSGAAAGITIAIAACVTGKSMAAIHQLPDTTGLKNEVIVHKSHRNGYDHAVRQVGVKLVEIGYAGSTAPWQLEAAINERTAAIIWFQGTMTGHGDIPLEQVVAIAKPRGVPVIVDAAAQLPPVENLWNFTKLGVTAAIFSGGKDLRGPQSSGLVLGQRELVEAMRLNGPPHHSIGRPMKVGKEELCGALAAVRWYLSRDHEGRLSQSEEVVGGWCGELNRLAGVSAHRSFPNEAGQPMPRAQVHIDAAKTGMSRDEVMAALLAGTPAITVSAGPDESIFLNPMTLEDGEETVVLDRLLAVLRRI